MLYRSIECQLTNNSYSLKLMSTKCQKRVKMQATSNTPDRHTRAHAHTHACTRTCTHICTHIHAHMCAHTHAHTHTHTQARDRPQTHVLSVAASDPHPSTQGVSCSLIVKNPELDKPCNKFSWKRRSRESAKNSKDELEISSL